MILTQQTNLLSCLESEMALILPDGYKVQAKKRRPFDYAQDRLFNELHSVRSRISALLRASMDYRVTCYSRAAIIKTLGAGPVQHNL
jgi:hypothetical protein